MFQSLSWEVDPYTVTADFQRPPEQAVFVFVHLTLYFAESPVRSWEATHAEVGVLHTGI
jgi:hypothetical protein